MTLAVRWTKHAADQFVDAAQYLEESRVGTGLVFIDAVEAAVDRAAGAPYSNPQIPGEPQTTRKALVGRFGYCIIYEVDTDQLIILTIWHAVQKPGSWRGSDH